MINAKFSGRIDAGSVVYIDGDFFPWERDPRLWVHPNVFVLDDLEIEERNLGSYNEHNYAPKDTVDMQYVIEDRDYLELVDITTGKDVEFAWTNAYEKDYYVLGPRPCLDPVKGYVEPSDIEHLGAGYYLICEFASDVMESISIHDDCGGCQEVEAPFVVRFAIRLEVDE